MSNDIVPEPDDEVKVLFARAQHLVGYAAARFHVLADHSCWDIEESQQFLRDSDDLAGLALELRLLWYGDDEL